MELTQSEVDKAFEAILKDDIKVVKQAINKGFTGLTRSSYSDMALHFACLNNKLTVIDLLISTLKDDEINTINVDDEPGICGTALHMSMDGQIDPVVVERLLKSGADPNAKDAKGSPVLHELIYRAWEDIEAEYQEKDDDSEHDDETHYFDPRDIREGIIVVDDGSESDIELEESLESMEIAASGDLENNENVREPKRANDENNTIANKQLEEKLLYERVPTRNSQDKKEVMECGVTNQMYKLDSGRILQKIGLLHKYSVFMNIRHTVTQMTPAHYWFQKFNWAMVYFQNKPIPDFVWTFLEALLDRGTSLDCVNSMNETAVVYLTQRHYKPGDTIYIESIRQLTEKVLEKCMLFSEKDIQGRTLLHNAVEHCNIVMVKLLLDHYPDLNDKDRFGLTPLHLCTHTLTVDEAPFVAEMINDLVKKGADVNSQDLYGATPLHHAVSFNNHAAIKCLLLNGAKMDVGDNNGILATDTATINGNRETLELLGQATDKGKTDPVVSDIRYGWSFPLCCHKQYSTDSRGWEDPEQVDESKIDEWLAKYPVCEHNRKLVLQNSIASFEPRVLQCKLGEQDARHMRKDLYEFATKIANAVKFLNPLFESDVIFGGSTSEETKIGSCDEFDLVFDLFRIGEMVDVVEIENLPGFVNLKVMNAETHDNLNALGLLNDEGLLNRTETSNMFHNYMQSVLNGAEIWTGHRLFAFWGQTNEQGECFNIGQMQMVWYGQYLKRQDVNVDIAPIIRKTNWLPSNWNQRCQLVDEANAFSIGCYLMMKDTTRYMANLDDSFEDEMENRKQLEFSNLLFKVSLSQLEHATMRSAPKQARTGYKLAKSIKIQCPTILFDLFETIDLSKIKTSPVESISGPDGSLKAIYRVSDFVTSYVIKTGLFYELGDVGFKMPYSAEDLEPRAWNHEVLSKDMFDQWRPTKEELEESIQWALKIYKRVLTIVDATAVLPEYFLKDMEATKVPGSTKSFVRVMSRFLRCLIYFLEHFEIPVDAWNYS